MKLMKGNLKAQAGFTMIEMIGVLAIIAILASVVAPKVFDAIRDAKINTFVANVGAVKTAVTSYYRDVGALPSLSANLVTSSGLSTSQVAAWRGPYIDKDVVKLFDSLPQASAATLTSGAPASTLNFDIDGDGNGDYSSKSTILAMTFTGLSTADSKAVSAKIDGDSAISGTTAWWRMGTVVKDAYTSTAAPTGIAADKLNVFIAAF